MTHPRSLQNRIIGFIIFLMVPCLCLTKRRITLVNIGVRTITNHNARLPLSIETHVTSKKEIIRYLRPNRRRIHTAP